MIRLCSADWLLEDISRYGRCAGPKREVASCAQLEDLRNLQDTFISAARCIVVQTPKLTIIATYKKELRRLLAEIDEMVHIAARQVRIVVSDCAPPASHEDVAYLSEQWD